MSFTIILYCCTTCLWYLLPESIRRLYSILNTFIQTAREYSYSSAKSRGNRTYSEARELLHSGGGVQNHSGKLDPPDIVWAGGWAVHCLRPRIFRCDLMTSTVQHDLLPVKEQSGSDPNYNTSQSHYKINKIWPE